MFKYICSFCVYLVVDGIRKSQVDKIIFVVNSVGVIKLFVRLFLVIRTRSGANLQPVDRIFCIGLRRCQLSCCQTNRLSHALLRLNFKILISR